jgi:hypothetical protein
MKINYIELAWSDKERITSLTAIIEGKQQYYYRKRLDGHDEFIDYHSGQYSTRRIKLDSKLGKKIVKLVTDTCAEMGWPMYEKVLSEDLLAMIMNRLETEQKGPRPLPQNDIALHHCKTVMKCLTYGKERHHG